MRNGLIVSLMCASRDLYLSVLPAAAAEVYAAAEHEHEGVYMFGCPADGNVEFEVADDDPAVGHVHDQRDKFQPEGCAGAAGARYGEEEDLASYVYEV